MVLTNPSFGRLVNIIQLIIKLVFLLQVHRASTGPLFVIFTFKKCTLEVDHLPYCYCQINVHGHGQNFHARFVRVNIIEPPPLQKSWLYAPLVSNILVARDIALTDSFRWKRADHSIRWYVSFHSCIRGVP